MELQKLWVTLGLDSDNFHQGLQQAKQAAEGLASGLQSRLGGAFSSLKFAALGAATAIGGGMVAGIGMAVRSAISMNASLEQSTMQFTTLMGDADMAAEHVANLFEFGAKTPFETEPIIAASKSLQVFGGEALNTMENLTLAGDAAAAVGAPIEDVSLWVGRLYSALQSGAPIGEAAARLQELGIMGPQARAELEAMQEDGASATEVFGRFQEQLGSFSGAMEMQATSWAGLTSTLSDNLQMAAATALAPFFDLAKSGLTAVIELINRPDIQAGIQRISELFTTVFQAVADFISGLVSGEDPIGDFANLVWTLASAFGVGEERAKAIFEAVIGLRDSFTNIIQPILAAISNFVSFKDVLTAFGLILLSVVVPAIVSVVISAAPLLLALGALIAVVALVRNAWENNWGGIRDKVAEAWAVLQPIFALIVGFLRDKIGNAIAFLADWWSGAWPKIQNALSQAWEVIWPILLDIAKFLVERVRSQLEILHDFWVNIAWPAIQRAVEIVWPIVEKIFRAIVEFVIDTLIPAIRELWEKWTTEWWPTIQTVLENVWTVIKEIFGELGRWINDNIIPWVEFLWDKWVNVWWPEIQSAIETAWAAIRPVLQWLREKFETVMGAIGEAITPVKSIWDGFVSAVQGFWDWISGRNFNIDIRFPDIPPPFRTDSPLVIHTRLSEWADDMPRIGEKVSSGFRTAFEALSTLVPDWAIPRSPLPIHIGWLKFASDAGQIGDDLRQMFEKVFQPLTDADLILGGAGTVGNLAGQFQRQFERDVIDPMIDQIGKFDDRVSAIQPMWERVFGYMGAELVDFRDPAKFQTALKQLVMLRNAIASQGPTSAEFLPQVDDAIAALVQRNDLNAEYVRQQERLLALEKSRADLDFLRSQLELLNLIKDNKLDTSILEGLTFGLGADAGDLMDAMVSVMQQLINVANAELRIHSPSAVAMDIGRRWNDGLIRGLQSTRGLEQAVKDSLDPLVEDRQAVTDRRMNRVDNSRRTVINGGVTNIYRAPDESILDRMEQIMR